MFLFIIVQSQKLNHVIDSAKTEEKNSFKIIDQTSSNEQMINVPQGSVASDIQQIEDLTDSEKNFDIKQIDNQQQFEQNDQFIINNLHLDTDEVSQ